MRPTILRAVLLAATALVSLAGCSDDASPEQKVRAVIEQMEVAAEQRDVGAFMEHISENYRDREGQGRSEAARYARGYFIANQSIHLLTRIETLEFPSADEARLKVKVGMAGREAQAGAASLSADLHDFDVGLVREAGEWKVSYANWSAH
jgi:hypothetical protein